MMEEQSTVYNEAGHDGMAENMMPFGYLENLEQGTSDCFLSGYDEVVTGSSDNDFRGFIFNSIEFIAVDVFCHEDIVWDNLTGNPNLNEQENKSIKKTIVNAILYMHGFEVDVDIIWGAVDKDASEALAWMRPPSWIAQDNWSVIDEIRRIRHNNMEGSRLLASFDAVFMMRDEICNDNRFLDITVPFFQLCAISGQESGYLLYYFTFEKIEGIYKLVGLSIGA